MYIHISLEAYVTLFLIGVDSCEIYITVYELKFDNTRKYCISESTMLDKNTVVISVDVISMTSLLKCVNTFEM